MPDRAVAWLDRTSKAAQSQIALAWDIRQCTPTTPTDSRHCCPICLDVLSVPVETPCGHAFCAYCLLLAVKISPTCPLDRSPLPQPPGAPITESFSLGDPSDDLEIQNSRELWAYRKCGAFLDVGGSVKQALEALRVWCPFRELEGCMVELPWDTWGLRTHITKMRHGETVPQGIVPLSEGRDTKTPSTDLKNNLGGKSTHLTTRPPPLVAATHTAAASSGSIREGIREGIVRYINARAARPPQDGIRGAIAARIRARTARPPGRLSKRLVWPIFRLILPPSAIAMGCPPEPAAAPPPRSQRLTGELRGI